MMSLCHSLVVMTIRVIQTESGRDGPRRQSVFKAVVEAIKTIRLRVVLQQQSFL